MLCSEPENAVYNHAVTKGKIIDHARITMASARTMVTAVV